MRINGVIVGFSLGLLLLWAPRWLTASLSSDAGNEVWAIRLAGAALIGLGFFFVMASGERIIHPHILVPLIVTNALIAGVLLLTYLQGEWRTLSFVADVILVGLVALCLTGAVLPVRYLRAEYRAP